MRLLGGTRHVYSCVTAALVSRRRRYSVRVSDTFSSTLAVWKYNSSQMYRPGWFRRTEKYAAKCSPLNTLQREGRYTESRLDPWDCHQTRWEGHTHTHTPTRTLEGVPLCIISWAVRKSERTAPDGTGEMVCGCLQHNNAPSYKRALTYVPVVYTRHDAKLNTYSKYPTSKNKPLGYVVGSKRHRDWKRQFSQFFSEQSAPE